jgi:hypothetical protein
VASTWLLETRPAAGQGASQAASSPQAEANRDRP